VITFDGVVFRCGLDGIVVEVDGDRPARPIDGLDRLRGDQYLATGKQASHVHDQVADDPGLVVEVDLIQRADLAVTGRQRVPVQVLQVA
jgi:hypothetical protein